MQEHIYCKKLQTIIYEKIYQSLLQNRVHMCNILFTVFDTLEIKIINEDSDQS